MASGTLRPSARWHVSIPRLVLLSLVLLFLSLTPSPITAAPPTVRSVTGCANGGSQTTVACHTGSLLTVTGTNFVFNDSSTVVNLGPYRCLNVSVPLSTSIRCRVPPLNASDLERRLDVSVVVNGSSSSAFRNGFQSYGALTLVSALGCANTSNVGTASSPAYRSSGCGPEDRLTLTGSGFGSAAVNALVKVSLLTPAGEVGCGAVTMANASALSCTLPVATPGQWLAVKVTVGADNVTQGGLVEFTSAPFVSSVSGCLAVNSTRTGLCHATQLVTIRGQREGTHRLSLAPRSSPGLCPHTSVAVLCRCCQGRTFKRRC